ncbi:prepilin peptidase [Clostridium sp. CT7]|nr:prepilin peptidase [Clostridium sp. CT7]
MLILMFLVGTLFGSFFNVCILRIPKDESIIYPSSHCDYCKNKIKWYDMIPLISYIILRGKCRYCGEKISSQYFFMEILSGLMFFTIYLKYGYQLLTLKFIIFISLLIVISIIDIDTTDVYLCTTLPGIISGFIFVLIDAVGNNDVMGYLFAVIISTGLIILINIITEMFIRLPAVGMGDAEVFVICGLFMGSKFGLLMLFMAVVSGGIVGIVLIVFKIKDKIDYMPFVPFITASSIITILFGQNILNFYNKFNLL